MAKYILVKKVKGKKYEYQVIDADSKAIVSKRTSAREYVACTADGSFYFGRLDLIGKGDHGKQLSHVTEILANPEKAYKKQIAYFLLTKMFLAVLQLICLLKLWRNRVDTSGWMLLPGR